MNEWTEGVAGKPSPVVSVIESIDVARVYPSPLNPRKSVSEAAIAELAESIKAQGLLQPITVRPKDYEDTIEYDGSIVSVPTGYEIVCGERRYRACVLAGYAEIPCIVREMSDEDAIDAMITENLQRKDVDPMEEAAAFQLLYDRGAKVEDLAARFGKSERFVRDRMLMTRLVDELKPLVSDGRLTIAGAQMLARLEDHGEDFVDDNKGSIGLGEGFSTSDVKEYLDGLLEDLRDAPFHPDGDMRETWNDGLLKKCSTCPCCSTSTGSLFPEMEDKTPRCANNKCYNDKMQAYFGHLLMKYRDDLVKEGEEIEAGRVVVLDDTYGGYNRDFLNEKYGKYFEMAKNSGFRVVKLSELGQNRYDKAGNDTVRVLSVDRYAGHYGGGFSEYRYYAVKTGTERDTEKREKMPYEVASEIHMIRVRAKDKLSKDLLKMVTDSGYAERTERIGGDFVWERLLKTALIAEQLRWDDQKELLPDGMDYERLDNLTRNDAWMRKAFMAFLERSKCLAILRQVAPFLNEEAVAVIRKSDGDVYNKTRPLINWLELRGYDEKGRKMEGASEIGREASEADGKEGGLKDGEKQA